MKKNLLDITGRFSYRLDTKRSADPFFHLSTADLVKGRPHNNNQSEVFSLAKQHTVGVVGLGRMGGPVVQRLLKSEFPVMVWDILPACREPFEDKDTVRIAPPGEMARSCRVVFFVVPSSVEIAACLKGKEGVLRNARKGLILCDLTTSDPVETRKLARLADRAGVRYLDCGMSGGPAGILAGKLTLMIGGDAGVLRRSRPYFAPFVENVFHLGPVGSGHAMKLIHNMVLHTIFLATCEGARMTERMGMKVTDMIDVFNVSTAYSYASRHRFPNNILNGSWNGQARIYNPWKDVGIAVRLARECGADVGFGERTLDFLERAVSRGMIEQDYSLLYRDYEEILATRSAGSGGRRSRLKKTGAILTGSATRKPRLVGGVEGRGDKKITSLPGSPALMAGRFT
jgi:3-hydroxyisobutyrate dehydrogenase